VTHLRAAVYDRAANLPHGSLIDRVHEMPQPRGVIVCPPDHFDVVDVKNPFMAGKAGTVDKHLARDQWEAMCTAFATAGAEVFDVAPLAGCEDMVFCANTALLGLDPDGAKTCVPSRMRFESRQPEVDPTVQWCRARDYHIVALDDPALYFEGSGDAIWHPRRRLLWGGYGWRTDPEVYPSLAHALHVPVIALPLTDSTYYHLDTCFCPVDERTVLVHAPAIAAEGMDLVRAVFDRVIDVGADEAERFACNGAAFFGKTVVLDVRAAQTAQQLRDLGYRTIEVDTGEFLKSGGSVYCMKNAFF
jgi:arginine dihydrolase